MTTYRMYAEDENGVMVVWAYARKIEDLLFEAVQEKLNRYLIVDEFDGTIVHSFGQEI